MSGQAYTPGLSVTPWTEIEKIRELPLPGRALVKVGDTVEATQAVLSAELPGELEIVRVADRLGLPPEEALAHLRSAVGDSVTRKQVVAELKSFFGWFTAAAESPCDGVVEFITAANAHLGIRRPSTEMTVKAFVEGEVIEVEERKSVSIRARGAQIQGIFGVGGERFGTVVVLPVANDEKVTVESLAVCQSRLSQAVLIGGSSFTVEALKFAAERGAVAAVTGSVDSETLRTYLGYEIGVSITGDEDVPLTLIVTEGFGSLSLSPRVYELAKKLDGMAASISGATQVRAGAVRPELFVALKQPLFGVAVDARAGQTRTLDVGSRIRVIRVPYFGAFGTVTALPHDPERMPSGSIVRVLKAKLESGEEVIVPRANVEIAD